MNNKLVHFVWIGDKLPLLGALSIKLFQRYDFVTNLWCYKPIEKIPENTILRDASEILPKYSLFSFQGKTTLSLTNNGIGSFAHWSDIFQLALLKRHGGWYSQLDVACMKKPPDTEYYFAYHLDKSLVNTFIMKTPVAAPFIDNCLLELHDKVNINTCDKIDWYDNMRIIHSHITQNNLIHNLSSNVYECGSNIYMNQNNIPDKNIEFIHWCNSTIPTDRNIVIEDSLYYKLLQQENLI